MMYAAAPVEFELHFGHGKRLAVMTCLLMILRAEN